MMNDAEIRQYLLDHKNVTDLYPVKISGYYRSLIRQKGDGIWQQCMPSPAELENPGDLCDDGLGERSQSPCPRLIHRYPDRALIFATNSCFAYCRFCFRKRFWKSGVQTSSITDGELQTILRYLQQHPEVKDVLLSGGDPLTLPDERLAGILQQIFGVPSVETVRLCTRAPVVQPGRITPELAGILAGFPALWVMTHFNHPAELTPEAAGGIALLRKAGLPILNQTVLLKGVNDDPETLCTLFRGLVRQGVKPHYLFHCDPIRGTAHFATGIDCGLEILRYCRKNLSSIATPFFAIDLPEGGGKVSLQPDYRSPGGREGSYHALDGREIFHPLCVKKG